MNSFSNSKLTCKVTNLRFMLLEGKFLHGQVMTNISKKTGFSKGGGGGVDAKQNCVIVKQ